MINNNLLQKYAKLIVTIGANVQKGQQVFLNSSTNTRELARLIAEEAYKVGAKNVQVNWRDEYILKSSYIHKSIEDLSKNPEWNIAKYREFIDNGGCAISIVSPVPDLNDDVDPNKLQAYNMASRKDFSFYYDHMMASKSQWVVVAAPNKVWAKKVFPELSEDEAEMKLWEAILYASRVSNENDPIEEWNKHNASILAHNKILNNYGFDSLHFTNGLGTDCVVKLVDDHIWSGGTEHGGNGINFNPNIPTEENFTMPHKDHVNGRVYATKPLDYQGKLIKDFWVEFKDGKVIDFDAKENKESLKKLLEFDEGSSHIGEIALISHDSPISNLGILFYNTLFDENASCHMALGRAYTINMKNGNDLTLEERQAKGYNHSMIHYDFMFGSKDMQVKGITKGGKEVIVFKNGNFVI